MPSGIFCVDLDAIQKQKIISIVSNLEADRDLERAGRLAAEREIEAIRVLLKADVQKIRRENLRNFGRGALVSSIILSIILPPTSIIAYNRAKSIIDKR